MSNPPGICYEVYTYVTTLTLPDLSEGYMLTVSDEYRTTGIVNIANSSATGIAFTAQIPGIINGTDYHINTSPEFDFKDTAIVCYKGNFTYSFSATDLVDKDSLSYTFGDGLNSSSMAFAPFFSSLNYVGSYTGNQPLGGTVTINPATGLISGQAPDQTGEYVIAVYVKEWRKGVLIDSVKKELQVYVYDCSLSGAALDAVYQNCNDYKLTFSNQSAAANIIFYNWDFGVPNITTDVSTQAIPTYAYPDTGTFVVKLKVGSSSGCLDSATALAKIYPGFKAGFTVSGSCYQSPFQFTDTTQSPFGNINLHQWDFGDLTTTTDVSGIANPTYQYPGAATITATLVAGNDKGCIDTARQTFVVNNKPFIQLAFKDTLICSVDTLALQASTSGTSFNWSPVATMSGSNTLTPLVFPKDTTRYVFTAYEKGCVGKDTVTVNVLDFITVQLPADTGICKTDTLTLKPVSHALSYQWTELPANNSLNSYTVKYPVAKPLVQTTYAVTANLGKCQDKAQFTVHVSPYPTVDAGADTTICKGTAAYLHGTTNAPYYTWAPTNTLSALNTLQPVAKPTEHITYYLTVTDTTYCTKPVTDSVAVAIIYPIQVQAGNDTTVTLGQALQLAVFNNSSYAYQWYPAYALNNAKIYNPVATFYGSVPDSVTYTITVTSAEGCTTSDQLTVTIFKTEPDVFVPTGFTPNGDGRNDVLKAIPVGISHFDYLRIFNRWGQLVFETSNAAMGWDGTQKGIAGDSGTYIFVAQGIDYRGRTITKKGTVVLLR
jgi:gliding motility-associated-like protein